MNRFKRKPDRKKTAVNRDVKNTDKITRDDILDIVNSVETKEEAIAEVTKLVNLLSIESPTTKIYGKDESLQRIVNDLDSYKNWEEA